MAEPPGGNVRRAPRVHPATSRRNAIDRETLLGQHSLGLCVEHDLFHGAVDAQWIAVFGLRKFDNAMIPITNDSGRNL